jgi:cell filamentation protein
MLAEGDRYDISGLTEAQYEPSSNDQVLKNLLAIKSKQEMDRIEALELEKAVDQFVRAYSQEHRFTETDVLYFHEVWLSRIYEWAGKYRQVNVTKGDFPFAAAAQIPRLMQEFDKGLLRKYTPCNFTKEKDTLRALAETHTELVLIHPFRDGNGRVARILSTLMALQAGLPLLDFSVIASEKKQAYFDAVRAGLNRDYGPMERVFSEVIKKTLSAS